MLLTNTLDREDVGKYVGNSRLYISQCIQRWNMKSSLHKLSVDIRVSYAISNIQSEQEVHVEHRFDDCLNLVKLLGARWDKN